MIWEQKIWYLFVDTVELGSILEVGYSVNLALMMKLKKNVTTEYSGSYVESLDKFLSSHGWNCQKFSTDHHYDDTARANFILLNTDETWDEENLRIVEFGRVKCEINEVD